MHLKKNIIIAVIVSASLIVPLFKVNFEIVERILRIDYTKTTDFMTIKKKMVPIKKALVLQEFTYYNQKNSYGEDFLKYIELPEETIRKISENHNQIISMDWIIRANPLPPLVGQIYPQNYPDSVFGFSFGYLDAHDCYNQISWFGGETSLLPSALLSKKFMNSNGDYYVRYLLILKMEKSSSSSFPVITLADWSAYSGGSYDGLEALSFSLLATPIEIVLFNILLFMAFRKTKNSKTIVH